MITEKYLYWLPILCSDRKTLIQSKVAKAQTKSSTESVWAKANCCIKSVYQGSST